jgi:hypothetical protein
MKYDKDYYINKVALLDNALVVIMRIDTKTKPIYEGTDGLFSKKIQVGEEEVIDKVWWRVIGDVVKDRIITNDISTAYNWDKRIINASNILSQIKYLKTMNPDLDKIELNDIDIK